MGLLQVTLFGGMRLTYDDWRTEVTLTREIQLLLAYLILQRHRVHSRDVLASIFWGEQNQEKARGSLNTALWKLKKALEPAGTHTGAYLKIMHASEVGFNNEAPHWLDIEVFEEKINGILSQPFETVDQACLVELEAVLGLYKGELLEGCYKDWVLRERERLRGLYVKSLIYLLHVYRFHGAIDKAIAYGQQVLELNPLREEIQREMMKLYLQNGQRALAVQQYEICRLTLAKELGISPMEDTQRLYAQICMGIDANESPLFGSEQIDLHQALVQLREASQIVDLAKEKILQALQLISKYSGGSIPERTDLEKVRNWNQK